MMKNIHYLRLLNFELMSKKEVIFIHLFIFAISMFILSINLYCLFNNRENDEEKDVAEVAWAIEHYFDTEEFSKIFTIIIIVLFIVLNLYYLYAAILLKNLIYTFIIIIIVFNIGRRCQAVTNFIETYELNLNSNIPQYIFTILEVFIVCNVIFEIFQ